MEQTRFDPLDCARSIVFSCLESDFCKANAVSAPIHCTSARRGLASEIKLAPRFVALAMLSVPSFVMLIAWLGSG